MAGYAHYSKSAGVLLILGTIAAALSLPPPPPLVPLVLGVAILYAMIELGLYLGQAEGLGAPLLDSLFSAGALKPSDRMSLAAGLVTGTVLGGSMLLWLRFILSSFAPIVPAGLAAEAATPAWKRCVVAFDSAVLEELVFRLFLVSLLVWILRRPWLPTCRWPAARLLWIAIAAVAFGFGAAHLPKWFAVAPPGITLGIAVVSSNAIGGMTFGWLYWRRGIEAAILAHFAADVVLHVVGPGVV